MSRPCSSSQYVPVRGLVPAPEVNRLYRQHNTAMTAVEVLLRENMALRQQVEQLQRERILRAPMIRPSELGNLRRLV